MTEHPSYFSVYSSPLGKITLRADSTGLSGLWLDSQNPPNLGPAPMPNTREASILSFTALWLDAYFSGRDPGPKPPLHLIGSDFQKQVWALLLKIPYGRTITYGEIAKTIAAVRHSAHMSAQAVGGAVKRNPVSIIVPCHRVVGANDQLTGYAGGLDKKCALLRLEGTLNNHK